jgi:uncharacterized membrane protein YagU involved in acid resistance
MRRALKGAIAGTLATVPMTLVMLTLHRRLPASRRYPLPPQEITVEMARRAGAKELAHGRKLLGATLVSHFSYGAATGALYSMMAPPRELTRGVLWGTAYGVSVWAASYLGWVPALRILVPATRHPRERNALMIAAHIVWGSALGALCTALKRYPSW